LKVLYLHKVSNPIHAMKIYNASQLTYTLAKTLQNKYQISMKYVPNINKVSW